MGLFSRRNQRIAPDNLATMLTEWGKWEFDPTTRPTSGGPSSEFILGLSFRQGDERAQLRQEIYDVALQEGGWTLYGASDAIDFLDPVPDEMTRELASRRVRFLLSLNLPDLMSHLNSVDLMTLREIDPEEYARISP